jgi:hypothetical protein
MLRRLNSMTRRITKQRLRSIGTVRPEQFALRLLMGT